MRQPSIQNNQSVVLTRSILLLPLSIFAGITFLTHISRILDLRFDLYAICSGLATIFTIFIWVLVMRHERKQITTRDTKIFIVLLLLGVAGAILASIYQKPNSDDYFYVPNAVHFLTYPRDAMGNEIHFVYTGGKPILSVIASTSGAFEYAQTLLATLLGLDYLMVYHVITVAFVGFTIPLAIYLLFSNYAAESSNAVMATAVFVMLLLLLGDTIYSFGSYSFTRIFQGKVVFIAAGFPLFSALSLDYLSNANFRRWIYLAVAGIAFSGLTSTTFFLLPMLALGLGLAYELSFPLRKQSLVDLVTYGSVLIYPLVYGLYASQSVSRIRGVPNPLSDAYPANFTESLQLFINPLLPITPVVTLVSILLAVVLLRGTIRKFLLLWVGVIVFFFLNPLVSPFWIEYVTSRFIYWRVFLLIPLSSLVGAVCISILERIELTSPRLRGVITSSVIMILLAINFIPGSSSIYQQSGGSIDFPNYKVDRPALKIARVIAEKAPEGPMLAPATVAGVTTMLEGGHPQLHHGKRKPLLDWISWGKAERRAWASYFTEGEDHLDEYFRIVVDETPQLSVIVINNKVVSEVQSFLAFHGFEAHEMINDYIIYWK